MSLKKLLKEYESINIDDRFKGTDLELVYHLIIPENKKWVILRYFIHEVIKELENNDEELFEELEKEINGFKDFISTDFLEYEHEVSDNLKQKLLSFIEYHEESLWSDISHNYHDFTSTAIEFRDFLYNPTLIHFTDNARDILHDGFTHGTDRPEELSLTTHYSLESKKYGGMNFAYNLQGDFIRHALGGHGRDYKYGKEIIVCSVPKALEVYHYGDGEEQIIFVGSDAENISHVYMDFQPDPLHDHLNYSSPHISAIRDNNFHAFKDAYKQTENMILEKYSIDQINELIDEPINTYPDISMLNENDWLEYITLVDEIIDSVLSDMENKGMDNLLLLIVENKNKIIYTEEFEMELEPRELLEVIEQIPFKYIWENND